MPKLLHIFSALFILRLGLGINMLMHGLVRLPKLNAFATKMAAGFEGTFLPTALAKPFLLILPILEFLAGVLILAGGKYGRYGLILCGLILGALLLGTTLKEDWGTAGTQLIYVLATAYGLALYEQQERTLT
ncbi:MAG: DoxX family protein [Adhaeribacter sp.]